FVLSWHTGGSSRLLILRRGLLGCGSGVTQLARPLERGSATALALAIIKGTKYVLLWALKVAVQVVRIDASPSEYDSKVGITRVQQKRQDSPLVVVSGEPGLHFLDQEDLLSSVKVDLPLAPERNDRARFVVAVVVVFD